MACVRRGVLGPLARAPPPPESAPAPKLMRICAPTAAPGTQVVTWGIMGAAMIPLLPVSLQVAAAAAAEVGAPEDLAAGLMLLCGQYVGVLYVFVEPALLSLHVSAACTSAATPHAAFLVANLACACALVCVLRRATRPPPVAAVSEAADV